MKKQNVFFFITSRCNKRCSYCFVSHENDCMIKSDIDNAMINLPYNIYAENVIYGGEPTLYPDIVNYLVDELKKRNRNNITIYSNGYNLGLLKELNDKNIQIFINYDAYDKDIELIKDYDWIFTISPSNLNYSLNAHYIFKKNYKYPDFKIMHYYNKDSLFWNESTIEKLSNVIDEFILEYKSNLLKNNENYMPYFIKDTLRRLIAYSTNNKLVHSCHTNITFMPNGKTSSCYLCNHSDYKEICTDCSIKDICSYNTLCYLDIPKDKQKYLCKIQNMLFEKVTNLNSELKNNITWQHIILSICKGDFNGDM